MLQSIFGKKHKLLVLCIFLCSFKTHTTIIYVYLSAELPAYVHTALKQARLFNPKADIYLIANQKAINQCQTLLDNQAILAIAAENLKPSAYHQHFNRTSTLNTTSRDGLWRKATERFFYIHELMALLDLKDVVHVESDNMLYIDIAEMQYAFSQYPGIGAVFDCDDRCIPSVVYVANQKAMTHLIQFITEHAPKGYTDMKILALYRNTYSRDYIDNLPLIMPEYLTEHPLINALNQRPINPSAYLTHINLFNSIFDGAALGQYLGGIDPKNGISKPGFINERCIFNPSYLKFEWRFDNLGRKIPYAFCGNTAYRINNLHIHSKSLQHFHS